MFAVAVDLAAGMVAGQVHLLQGESFVEHAADGQTPAATVEVLRGQAEKIPAQVLAARCRRSVVVLNLQPVAVVQTVQCLPSWPIETLATGSVWFAAWPGGVGRRV